MKCILGCGNEATVESAVINCPVVFCSTCFHSYGYGYLDKEWKVYLESQEAKETQNAINPNYYKWHPVCEAVKITQEFATNLGCAINYIWRVASPDARKYDSKEGRVQDLQKAIRHLEFEIERIKESN